MLYWSRVLTKNDLNKLDIKSRFTVQPLRARGGCWDEESDLEYWSF